MYANRRNFRVAKEIVVEEHFRPEMEIRPFRAYAMKNMQYNSYLWPNCRHFRIIKEIGVLIGVLIRNLKGSFWSKDVSAIKIFTKILLVF